MIFDGFWVPHWRPFWVTFWYFLWFGVSKSMFGLQAWFLMIFDWKISWFVMSQPVKNSVNTMVFIGFHVFVVLVILMISGPCLDLILDTFEGLGRPFKWLFGVLDMHWNFVDFQDHPELRQRTWWVVNCLSRASSNKSYITSLLTSRLSNTSLLTCWPSNSNCWWNVGRILEIWHSMNERNHIDLWLKAACFPAWWPLASRGRRITEHMFVVWGNMEILM